jgi:hypothetical protein
MARASNAKKKYCHKCSTENENVGSVHANAVWRMAYITSNEPAVAPNKIRSRASKGASSRFNKQADQQPKVDRQD